MKSMRYIPTGNGLNPVSITPEFGQAGRSIIFYGGWEQNPLLLESFQGALIEEGIASAGFSAFEVIDPLDNDEETAEVKELRQLDSTGLLEGVPGRMIQRAVRTIEVTGLILDSLEVKPGHIDAAVTHCSGANVFLLARYIEHLRLDRMPSLNHRAILLEPMIARGQKVISLAKQSAEHEKKTADHSYISLNKMRHPEARNLGMQGSVPMRDILESRGMDFLHWNAAHGATLDIILGRNDIAAPESIAEEIMNARTRVKISHYPMTPDTARFGHGYVFAEQEEASSYIAYRLG